MAVLVAGVVVVTQRTGGNGARRITLDVPHRPSALVGDDAVVQVGAEVRLDATSSTDPDHESLHYRWKLATAPAGSAATLSAIDVAQPSLTPDVAGDYRVQLIVDDGRTKSDPAIQRIRAITGTVAASGTVGPHAGGLLTVPADVAGIGPATLEIANQSLTEDTLVAITADDGGRPQVLRAGQEPIGPVYDITPAGTEFTEPARLTLPVPTEVDIAAVRIGWWDTATSRWAPLDTTVDGDYVSAPITHLSWYALFYGGASTVRIVNAQQADPTDLPITVAYVAGPVQPVDATSPVRGPLPAFTHELQRGNEVLVDLVPGRYHFVVSSPRPQPGVANSLWFTVPVPGGGADDGVVDQTITIGDTGATSDDPTTSASIDFPGRTVVASTNLRPALDCSVVVPAGITTSAPPSAAPAVPNMSPADAAGVRAWQVGPIQTAQLARDGLTMRANAADPEGSTLSYVWTWRSPTGTARDHGTTASGTTLERSWSSADGFVIRAGTYRVFLTVYDDRNLFSECSWTVTVTGSTPPYLDVVVDDRVIDFGRLDNRRVTGVGVIPAGVENLCRYDAATSTLKTLPTAEATTGEQIHMDPVQHPPGMTCVYEIVADADIDATTMTGDQLVAGFVLPEPMYGRGNLYAAIAVPAPVAGSALAQLPVPGHGTLADVLPEGLAIGALIDSTAKLAGYDAYLSSLANRAALANQPHARTVTGTATTVVEAPMEPVPEGTTPKELPYVVAFARGGAGGAPQLAVGQQVTSTPDAFGQTPTGEVIDVVVRSGSWAGGDASGYVVLMRVTNDFSDARLTRQLAPLLVGSTQVAAISTVGQALPVVWEAPDDPNASGTLHDRRHEDEWTIARGGTVNLEARVTDGTTPVQREFGMVAFPNPWPRVSVSKTLLRGTSGTCPGVTFLQAPAGTEITYCFVITNESDTGVSLDRFTLSDPLAGITALTQLTLVTGDLGRPLAPHDWIVVTAPGAVEGDPEERVVNTVEVTARAVDGGGIPIEDAITPTANASATVLIPPEGPTTPTTEGSPPSAGPGSASDPFVVWFAPRMGYAPIFISGREELESDTLSCNYPGGGVDCTIILEKVLLLPGPYRTYADAVDGICSRLTNFYRLSGIYAGMAMGVYAGQPHLIENIGGCPAKYWPPGT